MFLSRLLTPAEKNYWPTELELACVVWTIKKVRHMIQSSKEPTIVQTDHSSIVNIGKQKLITATTSTMRLNVRLVRASQFLSQFRLDIRHKPGKEHIIPDALSRLASANTGSLKDDFNELDALYVYNATLIGISNSFRDQIVKGYTTDPAWRKISATIKANDAMGDNAAELSFARGGASIVPSDTDPYFEPRPEGNTSDSSNPFPPPVVPEDNELIYHVDRYTGLRRLCIPSSCVQDISHMAHGPAHAGFARTYEIITRSWYIRKLTKLLRDFIHHCPQCLVLQTRRHKPWRSLQPIDSPPIPFHTITLDFILALPLTKELFNAVMSVTDKFSKRITMIAGKDTHSAADWADLLLERLDLCDWGYPKVIITDRDRKFLSELWTKIFHKLGSKLLYSTAYHPQTDGSSERTNQTAEIALRHHIHTMEDPKQWPRALSSIQAVQNNVSSTTTTKTPNEVSYGFTPNRPLDLANASTDEQDQHFIARKEARDALAFANMNYKRHYDRKHQPLFLKVGEYALLKLHKGYSIPSTIGVTKKLTQQYAGPFKVLAKVGRLAYKLKIPTHWTIHPVFSIAQLEPCPPPEDDPFKRSRPDHPSHVHVDGDTPNYLSYEIERLLNKRIIKKGRGMTTQYLVRWRGYGPEWDKWFSVNNLDNAKDLIKDYEEAITSAAPSAPPLPKPSRRSTAIIPYSTPPTAVPTPNSAPAIAARHSTRKGRGEKRVRNRS